MRLSLFAHARDNRPTPIEVSWSDFVASIAEDCAAESATSDKTELTAIGPYTIRKGATRSTAAVDAMAAVIALDVDTDLDVDALQARVTELGLRAVMHGSPSDSPVHRKARIYVAADRTYDKSLCSSARLAMAAMLGVTVDTQSLDPVRIFFVGRLRDTPARDVWSHDGAPIVIDILDLKEAVPVPSISVTGSVPDHDPARDAALAGIVAALGSWEHYAHRKHATIGAVAGVMRRTGVWTPDDAERVVRAWLPPAEPGVDIPDAVRWARSMWSRAADEVSSASRLRSMLGDQIASVVCAQASAPHELACMQAEAAEVSAAGEQMYTIHDRSLPLPKLEYIVPGLGLAPGKISMIQGFAAAAKTPFALLLAIQISRGEDFLGFATVKKRVMYLDFEGGPLTPEREARICAGLGLRRDEVDLIFATANQEITAKMIAQLKLDCVRMGIEVLVIDTYTNAIGNIEFNSSAVRTVALLLSRIHEKLTVIALVHNNKSSDSSLRGVSGHGSLVTNCQASIALTPYEDDHKRQRVSCARAPMDRFAPFDITWYDEPCDFAPRGLALRCRREEPREDEETPAQKQTSHAREAKVRIAGERIVAHLRLLTSEPALRALIPKGGGDRRATDEALARLAHAKVVREDSGYVGLVNKSIDDTAVAHALGKIGGFST